jgi:hypothetical protein
MTAAVNLIPAARLRARRCRRRLCAWGWALTGYVLLLGSVCGLVKGVYGADHGAVAASLASTREGNRKTSSATVAVTRRLSQAESTRRTVEALTDRPDWSLLLNLLGQAMDDNLVLREVRLQPLDQSSGGTAPTAAEARLAPAERYRMELRGLGRTQEAVSRFVGRLEHTDVLGEVKVLRRGREPFLAGTAVSFDVECVLQAPGERR